MKLLGEWNWYLPRWLDWLPAPASESGPSRLRRPALFNDKEVPT